jgi:hypothetical protein
VRHRVRRACIVSRMLRTSLCILTLSFATLSHGAEPVIDNDRVTVKDTTSALPPAQHDFVSVSLSEKGTARFGHQGDIPSKTGARTVVVELKDGSPPPIPNSTGYPLAFPRPHAKKVLENDRVIVWDYEWRPGEATPMHFHDKDAVVVSESNGVVQSTTPDGKTTSGELKFGEVRFSHGDRTHSELLLSGNARAVIIELK